jgi:hypothetical protein
VGRLPVAYELLIDASFDWSNDLDAWRQKGFATNRMSAFEIGVEQPIA